MEQKQSKQRNIKTSTTKSDPVTEKTVLKAESVVEVKSKVSKATPAPKVAAQPVQPAQPVQTTQTVKSSKTKKVEAEPTPAPVPAPVQQTKSAKSTKSTVSAQVAQVAPVVTQQGKGKNVVKKSVTETQVKLTKEAPVKASKTTQKAVKATATTVPKAGVKTTKKVAEPVVKATKKVQKVNVEEAQEEKQMDDKLRYFKLYYNDNICGRYSGKKPKQAANKAFSSIIKDMRKTDNKEGVNIDITFTIKECTRNSFHKEYKYVGKRLLLKSPVKVTIENSDGTSKDIVYKYHNELKKAPKV